MRGPGQQQQVGGNQSSTDNEVRGESAGTQIETQSQADFWGSIADSVQALVGRAEGRSVVVNRITGVVVVRALAGEPQLAQHDSSTNGLIARAKAAV